jgi:hypothetical protein
MRRLSEPYQTLALNMIDYRAPLAEIIFTLEHIAEAWRIPGWDSELIREVLTHASRFVDEVIAPLDPVADREAVVDAANLGIQIHGGYGFLKEYRVEQILRDSRITQIYEGTNGIHAQTLSGRLLKVGRSAKAFDAYVDAVIVAARDVGNDATAQALVDVLGAWRRASKMVAESNHPGSLAHHYMKRTGLMAFGAAWAKLECSAEKAPSPEKIRTPASFVRDFMLPEAQHHAQMCLKPLRFGDISSAFFQIS